MSEIFNAALAEGLNAHYKLFGERFYARPPIDTGNALIGPFVGIFTEARGQTIETNTGFLRIQTRELTTSIENAAIIKRGSGASIEDPQGVLWRIRGLASRDAKSRTFELYREAKNDVQ